MKFFAIFLSIFVCFAANGQDRKSALSVKENCYSDQIIVDTYVQARAMARRSCFVPDENGVYSSAPKRCYKGNIEIKTHEDLEFMRSQWCIDGSILMVGMSNLDGENLETLDFGNVAVVTGIVYVTRSTYLKFLQYSNVEYMYYVSMWNNPMLNRCRVRKMAIDIGAEYRVDDSLDWNYEECE